MLTLVEECSGVGDLIVNGGVLRQVRYTIARYQGIAESGLPIPGLHRIEGALDLDAAVDRSDLVGTPLTLKLEDGRALGIMLATRDGRILAEGHGPGRCLCC
jgi:hypothetical protein